MTGLRRTKGEHVAGGEGCVCGVDGSLASGWAETEEKMPEMAKHPQGSGACGAVLVSS